MCTCKVSPAPFYVLSFLRLDYGSGRAGTGVRAAKAKKEALVCSSGSG